MTITRPELLTGPAAAGIAGSVPLGGPGRGIVPSGPIAKGDNHFDPALPPLAYNPKEARGRVKKAGYKGEEIFLDHRGLHVAGQGDGGGVAAMGKDVGVNVKVEVIEDSVRAQKGREKSLEGLWSSNPTSTLGDPDGTMWRLLGPGGPMDYWRDATFDEPGNAARFSVDEKFRGLQKHVERTPNPNRQFEIRPA